MPEIQSTTEDPIQIYDELSFVTSQDIAPGVDYEPAYIIEGAEDKVIGVERNTPFAPEFRDSDGEKLDGSTRVVAQKADPQGNALGNAIVLDANLDQFVYEEMRSDPDYFKTTSKGLIIDEREFLHIYVHVPESASNGFSAAQSRLTIGDNVTRTGKPVFIRDKQQLAPEQREAVNQASTGNGGE